LWETTGRTLVEQPFNLTDAQEILALLIRGAAAMDSRFLFLLASGKYHVPIGGKQVN